jgi:hypothetical protein
LSKCDFEKLLLEAIDEGLSTLGESSKQAIYFHLDKSFNIKKTEIPNKVEPFEQALKRIFGIGADFIETLIIKRLTEKVEPNTAQHVRKESGLNEYVASARRAFMQKRESQKLEVEIDNCRQMTVES